MRDDAGAGGGRPGCHARSVTQPTLDDAAASARVVARPRGAIADGIRAGLARVGIRTDAARDAAAAAAWAVLTVLLLGVLAALVWADGTSRSMSPAQGALIGILAAVQ